MEKKFISKALITQRLQLDEVERKTHYQLVKTLSLFPLFGFLWTIYFFIKNGSRPEGFTAMIYFMIFTIAITLLTYYAQWKRLRFLSVSTSLSRKEISEVIQQVADELNWHVIRNKPKIALAKTHPGFFSGSWGEKITILFDEDKVYINSICDPDKTSSVFAMGRNRKNERQFLKKIKTKK